MAERPNILIVDDEKRFCRSLEIFLREAGPFETATATDYYAALEKLKEPVDLVLTDLTMPGKDGIELLRAIRQTRQAIPVILMTAYSTVESAVAAMKEGALDYIVKPFESEDLLLLIRKALARRGAAEGDGAGVVPRYGDLIGASASMQEVYYRIRRAAETDSTVLVTGESGTGKELVARAIHFSGARKARPFVALNCNAVPETLLESELFGHEKGAFTGAFKLREGKFELAAHGTLFLDEIGEMAPVLQVKLLRVLQERAFERVGGKETVRVDVRIVAATNRDLEKAVKTGAFRDDLYYRLNVVAIHLPPLRERMEDLPLLVDHFLAEKCRKVGHPPKTLSPAARDRLFGYDFPGNVRELENILERAVVIARGAAIDAADLPIGQAAVSPPADAPAPLENGWAVLESRHGRLEKELIERAVRVHPGKSNAELAKLLGTSRRVLENRLKRFGIRKNAKS